MEQAQQFLYWKVKTDKIMKRKEEITVTEKNEIVQRLQDFRKLMKENCVQYYIVPTSDFHKSEYVNDYFKIREFLSGFTGSNGTLLVTESEACLWTDGRYFIQAEKELQGSTIRLMKMAMEGVPTLIEFLESHVQENECIGFDGRVVSCIFGRQLEKIAKEKKCILKHDVDLGAKLWKQRPDLPCGDILILSDELTGQDTKSKLRAIRDKMREQGTNIHVLTKLDDLMWLFNVRGGDIPCNPVALSYGIITQEEVYFYLQPNSVSEEVKEYLKKNGILLRDYNSFYQEIKEILCQKDTWRLLLDEDEINYTLYQLAIGNSEVKWDSNPSQLMKAVKNPTELKHMRDVYIKDSVAVTRFIYYIKQQMQRVNREEITEISAAEYLEGLRRKTEGFLDLSFDTISAYRENAAMMHYSATEQSNKTLEPIGFFLVDSGGQYLGGTTDVTRTIALGPLTEEERRDYTLVAAGMLRLLNLKFLKGCAGRNLDIVARQPLWQIGKDYKCGTGHGIGYILNVHEGPQRISVSYQKDAKETPFQPGMVVSDEPGVYMEGQYGIRTENVLVCRNWEKTSDGQFLCFENLTFVPIDLDAIDVSYLTQEDRIMLNDYHRKVYEVISPYLDQEECLWLKENTREI